MRLRTHLATHGNNHLKALRRACTAQAHNLPHSTSMRLLARLDAAAIHLATLNPAKIKYPTAIQHRADLDCAHALIAGAAILSLPHIRTALIELT